jgi:hypothetical protein
MQPGLPVVNCVDPVALVREQTDEQLSKCLLVLDHEEAWGHGGPSGQGISAAHVTAARLGDAGDGRR